MGTKWIFVLTDHSVPRSLLAFLLSICMGCAWAADFSGSWYSGSPEKGGVWLQTQQQGARIRFQLEASRGAPSYNAGEIEGEFELRGNAGTFKQTIDDGVCEISFVFSAKQVELRQNSSANDCGFGYAVNASGLLRRKSTKSPKFSNKLHTK